MDADPKYIAATRRRDLTLTIVMFCIAITPAWLTPSWFAVPWLLVVGGLSLPALWLTWGHAPWVPTPADELPRIVAALEMTADDRFCDLGCGDGRVVVGVQRATGAVCTGIEAAPLMWLIARLRVVFQPRAHVRFGDLYGCDLSDYTVIYVWGTAYSVGTERFSAFVRRTAKPGTRVVSYHTQIPGLERSGVDESGQRPIHIYQL